LVKILVAGGTIAEKYDAAKGDLVPVLKGGDLVAGGSQALGSRAP
jgi:hypothetical protein